MVNGKFKKKLFYRGQFTVCLPFTFIIVYRGKITVGFTAAFTIKMVAVKKVVSGKLPFAVRKLR